ncbi:hypothetical protein PR048_011627 [Dryococelus australis]|uniref:Uncharacterized protein n=1 Tax=Dryococelus australis TaxID=614101 RepID=A0ABQ9HMM1_9NEOP|nr:hypothetical protein PR048_011627 [Dryococelus australis]
MELEREIAVPILAYKQNYRSNPPSGNKLFTNFYEFDDVAGELDLWYNLWMKKNFPEDKLRDTEVVDLFNETNIFSPHEKSPLNFEHYSMYYSDFRSIHQYTAKRENLA